MTKYRFAKSATAVAGWIILLVTSGLANTPNTPNTPSNAAQSRKPARSVAQAKAEPVPANDFDGLDYTEEQKAEMSKIHREIEANKAAVVKDDKLNEDQKNAMLVGYTRMEYGRTYQVLTPAQQKTVRQRMNARKAAGKPVHKPQPPVNALPPANAPPPVN